MNTPEQNQLQTTTNDTYTIKLFVQGLFLLHFKDQNTATFGLIPIHPNDPSQPSDTRKEMPHPTVFKAKYEDDTTHHLEQFLDRKTVTKLIVEDHSGIIPEKNYSTGDPKDVEGDFNFDPYVLHIKSRLFKNNKDFRLKSATFKGRLQFTYGRIGVSKLFPDPRDPKTPWEFEFIEKGVGNTIHKQFVAEIIKVTLEVPKDKKVTLQDHKGILYEFFQKNCEITLSNVCVPEDSDHDGKPDSECPEDFECLYDALTLPQNTRRVIPRKRVFILDDNGETPKTVSTSLCGGGCSSC
ncbi:MAG: hypothetical protein K1Y36_02055 [Blastocatellia bacterium]|nr:hypothetical protein [Blastocatellia bacterium]